MKNRKLIIASDLDSIIIDLIRPWLGWYNEKHDDTVHIDHVTSYKIENFTKKTDRVFDFFQDHDNYRNCPVLPGAAEGLAAFHAAGHDVVIATSTAGQTAAIKWELVKKAAPWLNANNVMVGSRKELIRADVFIDDAPKNITRYRKAWPEAHILTIAYPYNRDQLHLTNLHAEDHNNTHKAWEQIVKYVDEISRG